MKKETEPIIKEVKTILNIGAGKIYPLYFIDDKSNYLVNIDNSYFSNSTTASNIISKFSLIREKNCGIVDYVDFIKEDIFEFLSRFQYQFDRIASYRFLEHVEKDRVLNFIYLMSTALKISGELDIIVPDFNRLSKMILEEDVNSPQFLKNDIILTYELLNEPSCPHASIWTKDRIKFFFEYEERFKVVEIIENFSFDSRDIYLRAKIIRVK